MSKIFYFMGKSAAGKDTIFQKIQKASDGSADGGNLYDAPDPGRRRRRCCVSFCNGGEDART